ncbi:MAG: pilin [Candidatus Andersenbacteria bacterium]
MKTSKIVARISAAGAGVAAAVTGLTANAQGAASGSTSCGPGSPLNIPCPSGTIQLSNQPIGGVILSIIEIGLGVAGSVAVLFLIVGGFLYITAAGDEQRLEKAKTTLKNAIIGTNLYPAGPRHRHHPPAVLDLTCSSVWRTTGAPPVVLFCR